MSVYTTQCYGVIVCWFTHARDALSTRCVRVWLDVMLAGAHSIPTVCQTIICNKIIPHHRHRRRPNRRRWCTHGGRARATRTAHRALMVRCANPYARTRQERANTHLFCNIPARALRSHTYLQYTCWMLRSSVCVWWREHSTPAPIFDRDELPVISWVYACVFEYDVYARLWV